MIFFSLAGLLSSFFLSFWFTFYGHSHLLGRQTTAPDPDDQFCVGQRGVGIRDRPEFVTYQLVKPVKSNPELLISWKKNTEDQTTFGVLDTKLKCRNFSPFGQ